MANSTIDKLKGLLTDGWLNLKTGFGDPRRDKRVHAVPTIDRLTYEECATLYRSSDILQKIVDDPARAAFREGWRVKINDEDADKETGEELDEAAKRLDLYGKACDVLRWSREFGGAALFVGANDGQTADMPLKEDQIKSIDFMTALDAIECRPVDWYSNPKHPKYGLPRLYDVQPRVFAGGAITEGDHASPGESVVHVHESRIIPLFGSRAERNQTSADSLRWGDSILQRVWQHVADFDTAIAASSVLMSEFAQPVFKVRGLAELMAADREDVVKKRIELLNLSRSVIRGILIDADGEDFERKAASLSGADGILVQLANRVAAASDFPVSLLFGQAPAGLNANGASDVRFWYDRIKAIQIDAVRPLLTRAFALISLAKDSPTKGEIPDDWCIEPNALWQESDSEQATRNLTQAQADQIYLVNGVLSPEEVRKSRFGGDGFSTSTHLEEADSETETETDDETIDTEGATRMGPDGQPLQVPAGQPTPKAGAPGAPGAAGGTSIQDTALNGTQVSSMIEVVTSVVQGKISRESGLAILKRAFRVSEADANEILGPEDFEAEPDPIEQAKAEALKSPPPPGAPGVPGAQPPPRTPPTNPAVK